MGNQTNMGCAATKEPSRCLKLSTKSTSYKAADLRGEVGLYVKLEKDASENPDACRLEADHGFACLGFAVEYEECSAVKAATPGMSNIFTRSGPDNIMETREIQEG